MAAPVRKEVDSTVRASLGEAPAPSATAKFTRAPLANEIPEQGIVIANIGGTVYLVTRIGNIRYRVAMASF
jgi:hypothetical protein